MVRIRYARTADGVDIAYAVEGSGPPLLVARPLLRAAVDYELDQQFDPELPRLARTRSVVIWDPRGLGLSSKAVPAYTMESSILDLEAVANALGLGRFDLLAYLTPAHTAIRIAARHPERVRRLALWNPSKPGDSPRTTTLVDVPDIAATHFKEYMQLWALRIFGWDRAEGAKQWVENILANFTSESWSRFMDSMEELDATPDAPSVSTPSLVMLDASALDPFTARRDFVPRLAATLPNAELALLKPEARGYAQLVDEFLSRGADADEVGDLPSGMIAILFADIVDSTALTERLGDAAFRTKARDLDAALRGVIREHAGTPIEGKLLGDGVLAVFTSARQAIEAALACARSGDDGGLPLHQGLHAGDVIREDNNVYGGAVNIASRIAGLSAAGEVLVSDTVRSLARTSGGVRFEDRGEQALKGVGEAVRVWKIVSESGSE